VNIANTYSTEWLVEQAWVDTIRAYQNLGALPKGLGVRHWQDVTDLPPGQYVMAHCVVKQLQVSNTPMPQCLAPAEVELGVFSATVMDSDGRQADAIRGIITWQMVVDPGFMSYFTSRLPNYITVQAVKRGDSHDYSENPRWKVRYVTFYVFGEFHRELMP
jgi:hypothetical protein